MNRNIEFWMFQREGGDEMKMSAEKMYATMQPWRLFFVVALPGMVSMFSMSIYAIIEGIFIGHQLGEAAFAAVNIAFPAELIIFALADLIGVGASAPISVTTRSLKAAGTVTRSSLVALPM